MIVLSCGAAPEETSSFEVDHEDSKVKECIYREATPLFTQIEKRDWVSVAHFLDSGYWSGKLVTNVFPDKRTPAEQAKTWVIKHKDNGEIKWRQLPIHYALILNAPLGIIRRLIELYPESIKMGDDEHMLPLHIAMRQGVDNSIIEFLLLQFPAAVVVKGKKDRDALACAVHGNHKAHVLARILNTFLEESKKGEVPELWKQARNASEVAPCTSLMSVMTSPHQTTLEVSAARQYHIMRMSANKIEVLYQEDAEHTAPLKMADLLAL